MKCDSCGIIIDKKWKYCPNCSKKVRNNKKLLITLLVVFIIIFCFIIFTTKKNNEPINEKYISKVLSDKYNEEFSNIHLVKSVDNPDTDLSCDGSSFGTIKGEGTTEYYKVYSEKNNIEFLVFFDNSDKNKTINDTYEKNLTRRNTLLNVYNITNKYFNENEIKFLISYSKNNKLVEIKSESELNYLLSHLNDKDNSDFINSYMDDIYININDDIFEFSKKYYSNIKEINREIIVLGEKYHFSFALLFNNNAKIQLDRLNGEAYVYDKFYNNKAWGETLDEFVMREKY